MRSLLTTISRAVFSLAVETPRSGHWPAVRRMHLLTQPFCKWCGSVKDLEVHHIQPFHLHPALELDPANLITLCESAGVECHFVHGHFRNWKNFNPDIVKQAVCKAAKAMLDRAQKMGLSWLWNLFKSAPPASVPPGPQAVLVTIDGVDVKYCASPEYARWISKLNVDDDGSGPSQGDPCYQNDTTLHNNGKALNALVDRWGVLPPQIIKGTMGDCMGALMRVTRISTGKSVWCVAGDEGPPDKIGEGSESLVRDLGDDDNPIDGGDDALDYLYELWPGQAAPGYALQGED